MWGTGGDEGATGEMWGTGGDEGATGEIWDTVGDEGATGEIWDTVGDEGATGEIWKIIQCVKISSVYLSFQSNEIKVVFRFNCYDNSDIIAVVNLQ
jgi:hypothetical protein